MRSLSGAGFFVGGPSGGEPVTLKLSADLVLLEGAEGRTLTLDAERPVLALGGFDGRTVVWSLTLPEGGTAELHFTDPESLPTLAVLAPEPIARQARALMDERRRRGRAGGLRWLGGIAIGALLVAALWQGAGLLGDALVGLVPTSVEAKLGALVSQSLVGGRRVLDSGAAHEAVTQTLARVVAGAGGTDYSFHVQLVDAPEVNAVAAPGGSVVVYTGLLRELKDAEELAGVLAHEVQHVLHRHGLRQLVGQVGIATAIGLVAGDVSGFAGLAAQLASLSYSRGAEEEADASAVALLHRSGIDPSGLSRFFARQAQRFEPPAILSTHPSNEDRQTRLKALAPTGTYTPLPVDWSAVQRSLGVSGTAP